MLNNTKNEDGRIGLGQTKQIQLRIPREILK